MSSNNELMGLEAALLGPSFDVNSEENIAVKAEDIQNSGGIDFGKHYFEPRIDETYLIKILPNPGGDIVTHRSVYKNLPDPERKGKSFHYVSSGNAKTCPALELFFEMNAKKKDGDAIAEKKIKKYLSRTQQGCVRVQILQSPKAEEVGQIRLFTFSTFGPNATVCNLINEKLNPTKEQREQGFEREDITSIFGSSVISLVCKEAQADGQKFRDFTQSRWAPKKRAAIAIKEDGTTREFTSGDLVDGKLNPEVTEWFKQFAQQISNPDYDVFKYFAYKEVGDPRMDSDTAAYVSKVWDKVNEIIPIIAEKSLGEIQNYGKKDTSSTKTKSENGNVLADSIPEELNDSVMSDKTTETTETKGDDIDDMLNDIESGK